jgi:hypothetical protein
MRERTITRTRHERTPTAMKILATGRLSLGGPLVAVAIAALTTGCTHEYRITPTYERSLAQIPERAVCARNESLSVSVVNESPDPLDAGQVTGGIHTFNHHFAKDPALAFQEGLTTALREGHCSTASPGAASLRVVLVKMAAHGETCGFSSCDGTAEARVSVTLLDAGGKMLSQQIVSTGAKGSCGMIFCNEEETSKFATHALSTAVGKTVAAISDALAKMPSSQRTAAAPPGS